MNFPLGLDRIRNTRAWQFLRDRRYLHRQRDRVRFYASFVQAGDLVFDIGANVGHYTLVFRHLGARVVAVEPQANLAAHLARRFEASRVTIVRTALGAAPSTAMLHKAPGESEIASLRDDVQERSRFSATHRFSETEEVPVTTLDALVARFGTPGFCKIDVEGFEREVLAGLSRPLPLLSLEFNREFWPETLQCIARLETLGFTHFNFVLGTGASFGHPTWMNAADAVRILERNSDPLLWGDIYARPH